MAVEQDPGKMKSRSSITFPVSAGIYIAVAAVIAALMYHVSSGGWAGVDADRFHFMAHMIIDGFTPYVDFVDPKPPLLYFVVALMDTAAPAGSIDIAMMAALNVISALVLYTLGKEDYGQVTGFFAGLLYLVAAVFVQGYFLFSEQFTVLFLLLSFLLLRRSHLVASGIMVGLAFGFKQYAILAVIPLLYLMQGQSGRQYLRFLVPVILAGLSSFGILYLAYGETATLNAFYWTFGIVPDYFGGGPIAEIPNYHAENLFSCAINLLASISMVFPTLVFALGSVLRRGLETQDERAIALFILVFGATLLVRQYLHYWILLLPFLALLACREFAENR